MAGRMGLPPPTISSAMMQPKLFWMRPPVTQSHMNFTPSLWWGRSTRVSTGSTTTAQQQQQPSHTHTHTHTHVGLYTYHVHPAWTCWEVYMIGIAVFTHLSTVSLAWADSSAGVYRIKAPSSNGSWRAVRIPFRLIPSPRWDRLEPGEVFTEDIHVCTS